MEPLKNGDRVKTVSAVSMTVVCRDENNIPHVDRANYNAGAILTVVEPGPGRTYCKDQFNRYVWIDTVLVERV